MNRLLQALKQICFLIIILLVLLLFMNVIMRYVVGSPLAWTEEAGQLLMVWLTFLGGAYAASERSHMGMDLLINSIKGKTKITLETIRSIVIIFGLLIVIFYGIKMTLFNLELKSESLQISYAFFYLPIPVGLLLYILFEINYTVKTLRGEERGETQ